MHAYRKYLAGLLALSLSASLLTACGKKEETALQVESQQATTKEEVKESASHQQTELSTEKETKLSAFKQFTNDFFIENITENTMDLHLMLKDPASMGITDYAVTLGDYSEESVLAKYMRLKQVKKELSKIKSETLTDSEQITKDVLLNSLDTALEGEDFLWYAEPLQPSIGLPAELPILLAEYDFENKRDIEDYLGLLADLDRYYGDIIKWEEEKSKKGFFMSDTVADMVIEDCKPYLTVDDDSMLMVTFKERLDALDFLSDKEKEDYLKENERCLREDVKDAYQTLVDGLSALKGSGKNNGGLAKLKRGKKYYKYLLKSSVGTDMDPKVLGDRIIEQVNSDLTETFRLLEADPSLEEKANSLTPTLTDPYEIMETLKEAMQDDFPVLSEDVGLNIKYVSKALEDSLSPAFYLAPPVDALDSNVIYINGGHTNDANLFTTLAHEGYPGHLYQNVYSGAYTEDDPIRRLCEVKGYTEGWAEYVEHEAYDYNPETDENLASLLKHQDFANLGVYALLDIYIHYEGFTADQIYQWLLKVFASIDRESSDEIYYTIVSQPTNYLNYYVGAMEFMSLRDQAMDALQDDFSMKEFHAFLLETGNAPFYMVRNYLTDWLKTKQ